MDHDLDNPQTAMVLEHDHDQRWTGLVLNHDQTGFLDSARAQATSDETGVDSARAGVGGILRENVEWV